MQKSDLSIMGNSSNIPGIPLERLRGRENSDVWQRQAKSYLTIKRCWSVVSAVAAAGEKAVCERALAKITMLIDTSNYGHIAAATTAKEACFDERVRGQRILSKSGAF